MEMTLVQGNKIGLGTVQFGLDYGVSNRTGQVSEDEVRQILQTAWNAGVRILDTAATYGTSEEVLGRTMTPESLFDIVTKVPKIGTQLDSNAVASFIRETFEKSLQKLRRESVYSLMFHDADDLRGPLAAEAYNVVSQLKQNGQIRKIGVSAYTQDQLEDILEHYAIDLIQIPVSVLDQRLMQSGYLADLHARGIEIHARSVFLQGLILMNPENLHPFFEPIRPVLCKFHNLAIRLETSPLKLALIYVLNCSIITTLILGVAQNAQLEEILSGLNRCFHVDFTQFSINMEDMVNPAKWKITP